METGPYTELSVTNLQNIDDLKQAIDDLAPYEGMAISNRTITYRSKVFSIESGRVHEGLGDTVKVSEGPDSKVVSDIVPHSEKVVIQLQDTQ